LYPKVSQPNWVYRPVWLHQFQFLRNEAANPLQGDPLHLVV